MINLLAQANPDVTFFSKAPGSAELVWFTIGAVVLSIVGWVVLMNVPKTMRRLITWSATFGAGLFYVVYWLWPQTAPTSPGAGQVADFNGIQAMGNWLENTQPKVGDSGIILGAVLLGLGIYSLMHVHLNRLFKKQKDWQFSLVLVVSMLLMVVFGYWDWNQREFHDPNSLLLNMENWKFENYGFNLLFDGFLQQMDAAMFSMIAFFILSAAYRAFRIRSIEATVLMGSALIMILSIMGAVDMAFSGFIDSMTGGDPESALNNLKITNIASWLKDTMQVPALRALEFGVGLGALAMGLRLWLGLEKGGVA